MTASYTVIVRNASQFPSYFYIFQKIATFSPVSADGVVCCSLGCAQIGNYDAGGSQITFTLDAQVYAGAVDTGQTAASTGAWALLRSPMLNMSTTSSSVQRITPTAQPNDTTSPNRTTMSLGPLSLSKAVNASGMSVGAFGIQVPPYTRPPTPTLRCGNAATLDSGIVVLSSSVSPLPNQLLSCTPESIYFVKVGPCAEGTPIKYDTDPSTSIACDFTTGYRTIVVQYNADGTFSIIASS
ncbi:hypothetical protein [Methylobacterium platani]|uniref:Uncharacterized protein n=2 Tax=Methylobacterium platani TaxID=427683 RepID=A0A179SI77_9HYPH|nr:hypothetical protein [Methylobacterium platani]KMO10678.1 hypothetical protein SQ03_29410 [Methylobacterium platani JCM 14648]OAS27275.1 hypothetical protein A5481_02295 [Methylobacterium platani]